MPEPSSVELYKQQAAERAVELVVSGMLVGLGSGSTAIYATRRLGQLLRAGQLRDIAAVATSRATAQLAGTLGVPLLGDDFARDIDVSIDGADEVSPDLHLIKGRGGALLREKVVAQSSQRRVIVVDDSKLSPSLGMRAPLPVECVPFGWRRQADYLGRLGATVTLRTSSTGDPFVTDQGNLILDCAFGPIPEPAALAELLGGRAGIVEHGLFVGLTTEVIAAGVAGVRHLLPPH